MCHALNPTKELVAKLYRVVDLADHTATIPTLENRTRLKELIRDPEIVEWVHSFQVEKQGGNGRPRKAVNLQGENK
jgi:hypothetical protein